MKKHLGMSRSKRFLYFHPNPLDREMGELIRGDDLTQQGGSLGRDGKPQVVITRSKTRDPQHPQGILDEMRRHVT